MFCILFFCFMGTAPMPPPPYVPDGQGGFVPFTKRAFISRVSSSIESLGDFREP